MGSSSSKLRQLGAKLDTPSFEKYGVSQPTKSSEDTKSTAPTDSPLSPKTKANPTFSNSNTTSLQANISQDPKAITVARSEANAKDLGPLAAPVDYAEGCPMPGMEGTSLTEDEMLAQQKRNAARVAESTEVSRKKAQAILKANPGLKKGKDV